MADSKEMKRLKQQLHEIKAQTKRIKANGKTSYKYTKKQGWEKLTTI